MTDSNSKKNNVRGVTSLSLDWLAKRLSKAHQIKEKLSTGSYRIDTDKVAQSMIDDDSHSRI